MYEINEKYLSDILRDHSKSIVGKLCKRIEVLDTEELTEKQKLSVLKTFQRELIYESFRDLKTIIKTHADGLKYYKFNIIDPLSTPKE